MFKRIFSCIIFFMILKRTISLTIYVKDLEGASSEIVQNYKKGGDKTFEQSDQSVKGERGDRGYVSTHQEASGQKGHHDREDNKKQYEEAGKKNCRKIYNIRVKV